MKIQSGLHEYIKVQQFIRERMKNQRTSWNKIRGERTLTFTVEDALLSPLGFSILSGAGLIHGKKAGETEAKKVHVHTTSNAVISIGDGGAESIDLTDALLPGEEIDKDAPLYIIQTEDDGSITGVIAKDFKLDTTGKKILPKTGNKFTVKGETTANLTDDSANVMVDFYVLRTEDNTYELQIDGDNFGGYYYVEADTLFRREDTGKDMPAIITLPNVKIQSNFTFSLASTGDPSGLMRLAAQ